MSKPKPSRRRSKSMPSSGTHRSRSVSTFPSMTSGARTVSHTSATAGPATPAHSERRPQRAPNATASTPATRWTARMSSIIGRQRRRGRSRPPRRSQLRTRVHLHQVVKLSNRPGGRTAMTRSRLPRSVARRVAAGRESVHGERVPLHGCTLGLGGGEPDPVGQLRASRGGPRASSRWASDPKGASRTRATALHPRRSAAHAPTAASTARRSECEPCPVADARTSRSAAVRSAASS